MKEGAKMEINGETKRHIESIIGFSFSEIDEEHKRVEQKIEKQNKIKLQVKAICDIRAAGRGSPYISRGRFIRRKDTQKKLRKY